MSINALLVPTLKNHMWHNCKPYWKASIEEQNQTRRPLSARIFSAITNSHSYFGREQDLK